MLVASTEAFDTSATTAAAVLIDHHVAIVAWTTGVRKRVIRSGGQACFVWQWRQIFAQVLEDFVV